jgi:cysteine synthase A
LRTRFRDTGRSSLDRTPGAAKSGTPGRVQPHESPRQRSRQPGLWLQDIPVPAIGINDVLIKVHKTGICGTDLHIYKWDAWAQKTIPVPMAVGHEFVGEIVEVGLQRPRLLSRRDRQRRRARRLRPLPQLPGRAAAPLCRHQGVGVNRPAPLPSTSRAAHDQRLVHPPTIDREVASIFDPFGNAAHTALSFDCWGEDVLITGAGPIGIMGAAIAGMPARAMWSSPTSTLAARPGEEDGASPGPSTSAKTSLADVQKELGMKEGFDVGLEMSGTRQAFRDMIANMAHGGKIALLGIPAEPMRHRLEQGDLQHAHDQGHLRPRDVRDLVQDDGHAPGRTRHPAGHHPPLTGNDLRPAGGDNARGASAPRATAGSHTRSPIMTPATPVLSLIGNTPLISLHFVAEDLTLLAKCEFLNPSGSIKDRFASCVIADAEARGRLRPDSVILECSSGNTGIALAMVGAARGYRVCILMSEGASIERRHLLRRLGAEVILIPAGQSYQAGIDRSRELAAADPRCFLPRQFENPVNTEDHERFTGQEILRQVPGPIAAFVAGYGTGGTLGGCGRAIKHRFPAARIVAMEPAEDDLHAAECRCCFCIEGVAGQGFVPPLLREAPIDDRVKISGEEAMHMTRRLHREFGLLVGTSSGANIAAALRVARDLPPGAHVVTILCDRAERYFSTALFAETTAPP